MVVPSKIATSVLLLSLFRLSGSYVVEPRIRHAKLAQTSTALFMIDNGVQNVVSRRCALTVAAALVPVLVAGFSPAVADVSDGSSLPQGARQFARVVKLKTDLKDVGKRLATAAEGDINKNEWDNIGKFLRTVYSTAENDMKFVAKRIFNPDSQKQALKDVDEVKKYAQAGDVSVSKQDASRLASIIAKVGELLDDFLDSLSDVPDEI